MSIFFRKYTSSYTKLRTTVSTPTAYCARVGSVDVTANPIHNASDDFVDRGGGGGTSTDINTPSVVRLAVAITSIHQCGTPRLAAGLAAQRQRLGTRRSPSASTSRRNWRRVGLWHILRRRLCGSCLACLSTFRNMLIQAKRAQTCRHFEVLISLSLQHAYMCA